MRKAVCVLRLAGLVFLLQARAVTVEEFRCPPRECRPWVYWWWQNGHVDEETIQADLADIKSLGFGGLLHYDSRGYWEDDDHLEMERPRNEFLDADWRTNLVFAVKLAKRLGLEFTMNLSSSAGWLEGPWKIGKGENPHVVDVTDRAQVEEYFRCFTSRLQEDLGEDLRQYISHFYACSYEGLLEKLPDSATDADFAARNLRYLNNFYRPMVECSHRMGIRWYSESGGPWRRDRAGFAFANQLDFLAVNDMPMGEFWLSDQPRSLYAPTFMYGGAVMAGRMKGTRRVAAEAFTHMTYHWSAYPDIFKRCADRAFADGVNHLVWHTYTASPKRYGQPGHEYFAGSHINRGVTWHDDFAPVVEYIARCQYLLQQGEPVVDYTIAAGPYPYLCKADLRDMPWDGGDDVHPPRGLTYKLAASENRDTQGEIDVKTKGLVLDYEGRFRFAHRRTAEGLDVYFLVGEGRERSVFRVRGKSATLWNPLDGTVAPALAQFTRDGRTAVDLSLPPNGSVFVVFSSNEQAASSSFRRTQTLTRPIAGPWRVEFRNKGLKVNEPKGIVLDVLADLTENDDTNIRHFAGTATYSTDFMTDRADGDAEISLGLVHAGTARVFVNGIDCGVSWCEPWTVRVPAGVLNAGRNKLSVEFTGTWRNRLIGDAALDPSDRTSRSNLRLRKGSRVQQDLVSGWGTRPTIYSGYCSNDPLQPSGLIGPVALSMTTTRSDGDEVSEPHQNKETVK